MEKSRGLNIGVGRVLADRESYLTKYIKRTPYIPASSPPASIMILGIFETSNGSLVLWAGLE